MFLPYAGKNQFWVHSNPTANTISKGSDAYPGTRQRPFATLAYALTKCTTAQDDVIILMENHSEEFTAASAITVSKSNIHIVGLGNGGQRPKLKFGADVSAVLISGSENTMRNINFVAAFADVAKGITITGADNVIDNCEFSDDATAENFLTPIYVNGATDNAADGTQITNNRWYSVDAACLEFVQCDTDVARMKYNGNRVDTWGVGVNAGLLVTAGKSMQAIEVIGNMHSTQATASVTGTTVWGNQADNDGVVAENLSFCLDVAGEVHVLLSGAALFENYGNSIGTVSAYILPARDTNA